MKAEYKRDLSGNYLVLYEEEEPDTSSYQMRMLVGNTIPSVLKCRVQGVDGQFMVCFDITSKQSVLSLYEEKKIGYEDLQMILGGFVQVMEEMAEYLLNPSRLLLKPEYMYVDVEKRQLYFCYLPGYDQDVRQEFQELTEYILPLLDHEDSRAVMLGYGIYRRALEDSFHLEHIKQELYQERSETAKTDSAINAASRQKTDKEGTDTGFMDVAAAHPGTDFSARPNGKTEQEEININPEEVMWQEEPAKENRKSEKSQEKGIFIWCLSVAAVALLVIIAETLGYLPRISVTAVLGCVIVAMGIGMLYVWILSLLKKKGQKISENQETPMPKESRKCGKQSLKHMEISEDETYGTERTEEKTGKKQEEIYTENSSCTSKSQKTNFGETVVLSANIVTGPATLVSREPGELATIYLQEELTVIGKMETAADAVIDLPTVSRIHAKIRKRDGEYYLTDLNSRNGTSVNGKMLKSSEEYCLQDQDEVDFAQARYVFLK